MRGHDPVTIDSFKGMWVRSAGYDDVPLDHFINCKNTRFGTGRVYTREKWGQYYNAINNKVRRSFIFNGSGTFIIYMTYSGNIYTQKISPTLDAPILRQTGNPTQDFDMVSFNARAYVVTSNLSGYYGNAMYVFDGTTWKVAGLTDPTQVATIGFNGGGNMDLGIHYFGYAIETKSGFISRVLPTSPHYINLAVTGQIVFNNLPTASSNPDYARIRIIATKSTSVVYPDRGKIVPPSFFVPEANGGIPGIGSPTTTVNFYDTELLESASYLQDIMENPPGGSFVSTYHNRLVVGAALDPNSDTDPLGQVPDRLYFSRVNDPETFDVLDGLLLIDPSSDVSLKAKASVYSTLTGLTDGTEYRDIFYAFKLNSTYAISDNGDEPSTWSISTIDDGNGSFLHGIITVLDSGGVNLEYILVANKSGIFAFNGLFNFPEMTWKIAAGWKTVSKNPYQLFEPGDVNAFPARSNVTFVNDPYNKVIYCLVCNSDADDPNTIYYCDYNETNINDPQYFMNVKWSEWNLASNVRITSIIGFDTGTGTRILGFNFNDTQLWELGITSAIMEIPDPTFCLMTSAIIKDPSNTVIHCNGISLNLYGNALAPTTFTPGIFVVSSGGYNIKLPPVTFAIYDEIAEKLILGNISGQRIFAELITAEYLDVRRINVYIKPTFKTVPNK